MSTVVNELLLLDCKLLPVVKGTKRPACAWRTEARKLSAGELADLLGTHNVGAVAGDDLVFIDVEGPEKVGSANGVATLRNMRKGGMELPHCPMYTTPSGGLGLIFRPRPGERTPHIDLGKQYGLELRTGMHYSVLPPSHYSGAEGKTYSGAYEWQVPPSEVVYDGSGEIPYVPAMLVDWFKANAKKDAETLCYSILPGKRPDYLCHIENNLYRISADIPYTEWWNVMAVCHRAGDEAKDLFINWSREKGGSKWHAGTLAFINEQWAALDKSLARRETENKPMLGLRWFFEYVEGKGDKADLGVDIPRTLPAKQTIEKKNSAFDMAHLESLWPLLPLPGFVEDFRHVLNAFAPWQTEANYAVPLVCLQLALQRQIVFLDHMTSHYWCFVGDPASGKGEMKNTIKRVLRHIDPKMIYGSIESGPGLKAALAEYPSRAILLDEGLKFLNSLQANRTKQVERGILALVLELHNYSDILEATTNKDKAKRTPEILSPIVTVVTMDQSEYWEEFRTSGAVDTGMLSRFFIVRFDPMPFDCLLTLDEKPAHIDERDIKAFAEGLKKIRPTTTKPPANARGEIEYHKHCPVDYHKDTPAFSYSPEGREVFNKFALSLRDWVEADRYVRDPVVRRLCKAHRFLSQLVAAADGERVVSAHHARIAAGVCLLTVKHIGKETDPVQKQIIDLARAELQKRGPLSPSAVIEEIPRKFYSKHGEYQNLSKLLKDFFVYKSGKLHLN